MSPPLGGDALLGEDMGNYVLATTTETDVQGPTTPGHYGGFFPKKPDWPAPYPSIVIAVDDINDAVRRVTEAGGKMLASRWRSLVWESMSRLPTPRATASVRCSRSRAIGRRP